MFFEIKDIASQKLSEMAGHVFSHYPDLFSKIYKFTRAKTVKALGYYPYYPKISVSEGTEVVISGQKKIMLGSNNYLGLSTHPEVIEAGIKALKKFGSGLTGSRLLNGNVLLHEELEDKIASLVGKERSLVYSTGYGVNLGVIAALTKIDSLIFSDQFNHASIIDGGRFSDASVVRYRHNDMKDLENKLQKHESTEGRLIVTDGLFSMEGDLADLPGIFKIGRKNGARIMVDEAHSIGVFGDHGAGTVEHFNLSDDIDLIMGTFSKSLGSIGGFIAAEDAVIEYLRHHSRTIIFSAALPPVNVATVMKALEIIQKEPVWREKLWENTEFMRSSLKYMGFDLGDSVSPVIPVIVGEDFSTFKVWRDLFNEGVYTNPVIAPAVPKGRGILRTSYMATHTRDQLEFCLEKFYKVGKKRGILFNS